MRVNDIFVFENNDPSEFQRIEEIQEQEEFFNEMIFEGYANTRDEAVELFESKVDKVIRDYSSKYSSSEPPEIMVFQDRANPKHYVVLGAGSGLFYRFDVINDKVVSEERFRDFRDLMEEKELLTRGTFGSVDPRSYLRKNWKRILMWVVGGSAAILLGGPIILAWVATLASAVSFIIQAGAVTAGVLGVGWIASQFQRDSATDRFNQGV